jgi:hypothetical protein
VANIARGKGQRVYKPEDFLPRYIPEHEMSDEEIQARAHLIAAAFGGEIRTSKP